MKKLFYLSACILSLMLAGCASKVDLGPGYQHTSKRFMEAMRWQDYRGAAEFLQDEYRAQLLESFGQYKDNLHIVEAEYLFSQLDKKTGTAKSELEFKYYLLPSPQVKEWHWKIDWVLIPVDANQPGTWQVQGAPPTFP
ncbi:hypothetical protein [Geopsychrobacter electrodiphilus]|uniref:hypothetical protein n=1 Tax=Geopsychrobacter electrodiphilus TaxID=225196 RepID=UPI0003629168|nr:hypothetical protein [Geopsychrobacter electrodiphilus]